MRSRASRASVELTLLVSLLPSIQTTVLQIAAHCTILTLASMDSDPDWAANALFSPSKARLAQAQARDWGFIDTWLSRKYSGKRPPDFERNEETLQALLTLATANEGADEQRDAVGRVERAVLQRNDGADGGKGEEVYGVVMGELSEQGGDSLNALAEMGVVLDVRNDAGPLELGVAVTDLQTEQFELEQQLRRVEKQNRVLQRESNRLRALLRDLKDDGFRAPSDLPEQTADWMKNAKHLRAKIAEYDERLAGAQGNFAPSLDGLAQQVHQLRDQQQKLAGLEAELKAFQSLPTNAREARAKVEGARDELRGLVGRREKLFEEMMHDG